MHRQAKQRRLLNDKYDQKVINDERKKEMLKSDYRLTLTTQLQHNSAKKAHQLAHERLTPHIHGTEGYPPLPEASKEQVTLKKREVAHSLRTTLDRQVTDKGILAKDIVTKEQH